MKAFLLAAGHGTRLRPYTDSAPKCLVPIQGKPILGIWLSLCEMHGILDVLVNAHSHADIVADFVRNQRSGARVTMVKEPELFGSAGTLLANRDWVRGEEKFWVFYADVLTTADLRAMLRFHCPSSVATLGVYSVPHPERCGIVSITSDSVVDEFVEKPAEPTSNLAFAGIMIGTQRFLDAIPNTRGADVGFDVLPRLIGQMRAYLLPEYLLDIGTPENYELAQQTWPGLADKRAA